MNEVIKLSKYRRFNYNYIKLLLMRDKEYGVNLNDTISLISATTHIPIIVVYSFAKEILNTHEYDATIESLKLFYHIKGIEE